MKILKIIAAVVVAVGLVLAIVAPVGPMPGLFIGGTSTAVPATWPDTSDIHEVKLKVPGPLPRVVIIWVIEHNGDLHIVGSKSSGWVSMVGSGGPVELRIGDNTYAVQATPVTEGWREILAAYGEKYVADYPEIIAGLPPIDQAEQTTAVFRLHQS